MLDIPQVDACFDKTDERDYKYSDMFEIVWAVSNKKKIIDREDDYQNQSLEEITKYWCVAFNVVHWSNILNKLEYWE